MDGDAPGGAGQAEGAKRGERVGGAGAPRGEGPGRSVSDGDKVPPMGLAGTGQPAGEAGEVDRGKLSQGLGGQRGPGCSRSTVGPTPVTLTQGHRTARPSSALGPTRHVRTRELLPASGFLLGSKRHREPTGTDAAGHPRNLWVSQPGLCWLTADTHGGERPLSQSWAAPFHTPASLFRSPRRCSA